MAIPNQSKLGDIGAEETVAKNGRGTVKAMYKVNRVMRIMGEIENTDG